MLRECIFLEKDPSNFNFLDFCLMFNVIFETSFSISRLCTILEYLSYYNIIVKCKWNFFETPIQSVQRSLNLLFQRTLFLMFPHFQKYLKLQVRTKKLGNSFFLPPLLFKISLRDTSLYISLNSLGFYLSRMLVKFSDLYIPTCVGKNFKFMVLAFLKNHWIYAFLLMS